MNRNQESHFSLNPTNLDISRSTMDRSYSLKTTFNVGQLIPVYCEEVLPGDTWNVKSGRVVRLQTMITPVMDNLYLDTYYFFVPHRLVWDHWRELMGENTESAWTPKKEYSAPQLVWPEYTGPAPGSLADYFGLPTYEDGAQNFEGGMSVSALPFRSYALIVNEWFRSTALQDPVQVSKGDASADPITDATGSYVTDLELGLDPFVVGKFHDVFSSCLPGPQRGPDVEIPVGKMGDLPVVPVGSDHPNVDLIEDPYTATFLGDGDPEGSAVGFNSSGDQKFTGGTVHSTKPFPVIDNLFALGDSSITATTINQLRIAFQVQKLFERDALGGDRYISVLKEHFGVTSPDARLQRPEYLGGKRLPLMVNQVIQQSESSATSPMGNVAGYSLTSDRNEDFFKSFTEHGYVIGLACVRYDHSYSQGLDRMWTRKNRMDWYWPVFANIGNVPVYNREIYFDSSDGKNDEVFGYQEAWFDYRYAPNRITGEMRPLLSNSLDAWHFGDSYQSRPYLSSEWLQEDKANVDRSLAVQSSVANQLLMDVYYQQRVTRPMPVYSIPGLIDHH